ncbi:hypothetical protein ACJMK2_034538 [Sinanodonta woodiana]|uniref:Uncharacterized protein n=1 Tax=Sinanodonta woodiana TaxID=1069815 RepID=A0ABD3WRX7_SINWO
MQYRQKNNFFLFTKELNERGLKSGTWNFHESGHGKRASDGIGRDIKRTANIYVLHGKDITNAKEFVDALRESQSNVVLYEVQDDMIEQKQKKIPSKLKTVPGTQKIHQIVYEAECPGVIYVRDISYRCRFTDPHEQHELTEVNFPKKDFPKRNYPKKDIPKKDFQKRDFPKKDFLKREEENQHTLSEPREEENQHTLSEPIKPPNREQFFQDCLKNFEECTTFKDLKKNYQANEQQNEFENHEIEMETNVTCENYEMATKASSENNKMATDETGENNEIATNITSENNEMATNVTSENNEMATDEKGENNEMATNVTSVNNEMATDEKGLVIDSKDTDVYVRCMHRMGRGTTNSPFFWPRTLVDECSYNMECVLTIIPEPIKIGRHYSIDEAIWGKILDYLKEN